MASVFNRLGTEVSILEYADHLISAMDHELGKTLQKNTEERGMDIRLQQAVYKAGESLVIIQKYTSETKTELKTLWKQTYILVAVGRRPYTENLGLENTGVKLDERGLL